MSDGTLAIIHRWTATTTSHRESTLFWLKVTLAGFLVGVLSTQLVEYGDWLWGATSSSSWILLTFLVLYTLCLVFVISTLSHLAPTTSSSSCEQPSFRPSYPKGLIKLQSYLAFFPITHIINHHPVNHHSDEEGGDVGGEEDLQGRLSRRVSAQLEVAIDAIVGEYVMPWYTKISDDQSFLEQCKGIIKAVFEQLGEKLKQVDRNDFARDAIQLIHIHWKEYTDALKTQQGNNRDDLFRTFKFVHPFLQDTKEVSKRYQHLVTKVLEELAITDLRSRVMCQFIAGILVKNFILFYVDMVCQPPWINGSLVSLLSSASLSVDITGNSSQNSSSPASPLPDPLPKALHMFDEGVEYASVGHSSTAESTPTTNKSCSSSGRSASQEDYSAKSDPETKHFFESLSSLDEGGTTEATTTSESRNESPSESTGGGGGGGNKASSLERHIFQKSVTSGFGDVIVLMKRPKDLTPLKPSMRTVSSALGSVIQATALPLLPSECYTDQESLALPKFCKPLRPFPSKVNNGEEERPDQDQVDVVRAEGQSETSELKVTISEKEDQASPLEPEEGEEDEDEPPLSDDDDVEEDDKSSSLPLSPVTKAEEEDSSPSSGTKNITSSHYYSFDEASRPKANSSSSFFETSTLSLDGALESRRQASRSKDQLELCSHEYRTDPANGGKPNRSPVYEEPEDFAASIAKLRSLLEQKGRKSATPPPLSRSGGDDGEVFESSEPSPMEFGKYESASAAVADTVFHTIPHISETCPSESRTTPTTTSSSAASSVEISKTCSFTFSEVGVNSDLNSTTVIEPSDRSNYERVPEIKCCFRNVIIPKVENCADAGGHYIIYCIQYEGVYYDDDDKEDGQPKRLVYRTTTIRRKFKEFLTLQAHLEENPACKPHLKGIKTPTRWLNVSLTKSDATVAHQRRAMLEKYLQQLCYHSVIGFCQELMIFMAYGEDGFCSFEVGDPKDLLSHRLDKLAKKFTGVINSLKDALPSFELDLSPAPNTPKSEGITPCDLKSESSFPSFPFPEKYTSHALDKSSPLQGANWVDKFPRDWVSANPESPKESDSPDHHLEQSDLPEGSSTFAEPEMDEGSILSAYPLAAAVTQLLCDVLWLPQYRPHPASVATFMSISGKSLENYVVESMDIFLSEEAILGYLEWLTITINNNNGQLDTDPGAGVAGGADLCTEQDLKNIVKRRIPAWVRWMWGRSRLDLTIDRITGLFQNQLVNHDLVVSLCELLFSKMVTVEGHSINAE